MIMCEREATLWAREEFGGVEVGDRRRRARVIAMATRAAQHPCGSVSRTFLSDADRQAAYDLLESARVPASALLASMRDACVQRCREERVLVPIDGSSINVVDRNHTKDFGSIGSYKSGGRGLKVVTAIAVTMSGTPLGICAQSWWARPVIPEERGPSTYRPIHERESRHLVRTIDDVNAAFAGSGCRPTCIIDREGDATEILHAVTSRKMDFIIRSSWDRRLTFPSGQRRLRETLEKQPVLGSYKLNVAAGFNRAARVATMELRVATVTLDLKHDWQAKRDNITVVAISAREISRPPRGEKPLHWILLTNLPATSPTLAKGIVESYTRRWRIEEFHKAWKSGACNVESTQLRSFDAVATWATLLAAVAIRIERLKQLARNEPDLPASVELTPSEIEAAILLKRRQKKRTETIPDTMPSIGQIVLWIAELGSYTGKSSGGPPGAITIGRGLERVRIAAEIIEQLRADRKIR